MMNPVINIFSGRKINPLNFTAEEITIQDIAHALALCNRFAGHTSKPISVAQHSVYVSRLTDEYGPDVALQGLLHDASEAILGDVTKWLKYSPQMKGFRDAEDQAQKVIFEKFDCPLEIHPEVEKADRIMVRFEGVMGFGDKFKIDHSNYPPLTEKEIKSVGFWDFWDWQDSEWLFLKRFIQLTK